MRVRHKARVAGAWGLALLSAALLRGSSPRSVPLVSVPEYRVAPPPHLSPSDAARWAGWRYRIQARQAADRGVEALEAWDPKAFERRSEQPLLQEEMLRDRQGDLGRARAAARQAAALARTPGEAYRAALLLAYVDCDAGDHEAELQEARRMMALQPHEEASMGALLHAAHCNDLRSLARRTAGALKVLREATSKQPGRPQDRTEG